MSLSVTSFRTGGAATIYRLPLEAFPNFWAYAHLIFFDDSIVLVDVGSGYGKSNSDLELALETVANERGEGSLWGRITRILITHAHLDHFGGLGLVRQRTGGAIGIHELDANVLADFDSHRGETAARTARFLHSAGITPPLFDELMAFRDQAGSWYESGPVDFTITASSVQLDRMQIIHVPGHSPGQVVVRIDDVLLSGDHILKTISPHQSPEALASHAGLANYLASLGRVESWAGEIRLTLGGHKGPISDLEGRIGAIRALHFRRLGQVTELARTPRTIAELSQALFPTARGRHALLALEETAAHVEHLERTGSLMQLHDGAIPGNDGTPTRYVRSVEASSLLGKPIG